jgi:hypothetical protein
LTLELIDLQRDFIVEWRELKVIRILNGITSDFNMTVQCCVVVRIILNGSRVLKVYLIQSGKYELKHNDTLVDFTEQYNNLDVNELHMSNEEDEVEIVGGKDRETIVEKPPSHRFLRETGRSISAPGTGEIEDTRWLRQQVVS